MAQFVWTKMQTESGIALPNILALKEMERLAGNGIFWWGIGSSLGPAIQEAAEAAGGMLPILFSLMLARPQKKDTAPDEVFIWTAWHDHVGGIRAIPKHVLEFSRGHDKKKHHYALVCRSNVPLTIGYHGPFDPSRYRTASGKRPADSQVTTLLEGSLDESQFPGNYHFGFRAVLIKPWAVKLAEPRRLESRERNLLDAWNRSWATFVASLRHHSHRPPN
jgi:hypothetical protein